MDTVLAWIGAIGGLLGGLAGVAFGITALVHAKSANKLAEQARDLAKTGEELSQEANTLSRESNGIAVDARQLAEEANAIAQRGEARETERNDVHWEGDWEKPGTYVVVNAGQDDALNVRATVTVDGSKSSRSAEKVASGESLVFDFPEALSEFKRELRERVQTLRANKRGNSSPFGGMIDWIRPGEMYHVNERILWETPRGQQCVHEPQNMITTFEEFLPDE